MTPCQLITMTAGRRFDYYNKEGPIRRMGGCLIICGKEGPACGRMPYRPSPSLYREEPPRIKSLHKEATMKIVMLGAPGAGKGTQAKMISEKYSIPHISTGDIFRANIKENTELGQKAKEYMDKGLLVPDELVVNLVVDRLAKDDAKNGYVLDGFPRTIPQAEALTNALAKINEKLDFAIDVEVPDENIVNRMGGRRACVKCGGTYHVKYNPTKVEGICDACGGELILRDDDKPETVKQRLDVYHEQTQPLIDYYTKEGILKEVDGTIDLKDVFEAIVSILEK